MDLDELKAAHPHWTIDHIGRDLECRYGPWRVRVADPDDAHREIERREPPGMTVEELGRLLAEPGF